MKIFKKVFSIFTALALLWGQLLAPTLILAQEATASSEPVVEVSPTPAPTPQPSESPQSTSAPSPSPEATPSATPTPTPKPGPNPSPAATDWTDVLDHTATTKDNVVLDHLYTAPQNNKVTLKFSKLPENPGKLTVKEVTLTPEQMAETGALSNIAYDISSNMEDGSFEYTLTLPTPKTDNVEVKASEDGESFITLGGVTAQEDTLTITGLNHFTVFVVAGTIQGDNTSTPFDESSSSVLINEFVFDTTEPGDTGEWVELFNKTNADISLTGWTLVDFAGTTKNLSGTIPAQGIVVLESSTAWLNNLNTNGDGDRITLKNNSGAEVDKVTYQKSSSTIVNAQSVSATDPTAGQSIARTSDGGTTWSVATTPTKGWFNDAGEMGAAPLLSTIDIQLMDFGISTNIGELDNPSYTPGGNSGLYFERPGEGKIMFTTSLNLTDQATVNILQDLGNQMEFGTGHLKFDSQTANNMAATGAKLFMYGLNDLGYSSAPPVTVRDDNGNTISWDDPNYPIVGSIVYSTDNNGQIVFDASHFTQFDIEPDFKSPMIDNMSITSFDDNNSTVTGIITVSANVTDNVEVSDVSFRLYDYWDGWDEQTCDDRDQDAGNLNLWSCQIDTTLLSEEPYYDLQVTANDAAGNSTQFSWIDDLGNDEIVVDNTFLPSSISGNKFEDVNGNSVKDEGEPGLPGWTIQLSGADSQAVVTDENGNYSFTDLNPGTYRVCEVLQSGWAQKFPTAGFDCSGGLKGYEEVNLSEDQSLAGRDFGNFKKVIIDIFKWKDLDADGELDKGEPPLGGWDMRIEKAIKTLTSTPNPVEGQPPVMTEEIIYGGLRILPTNDGGHALPEVDKPGTYRVTETSQDNFQRTHPEGDSFFDVFVEFSGQTSERETSITKDKNGQPLRFGNALFQQIGGSGTKFVPTSGDSSLTISLVVIDPAPICPGGACVMVEGQPVGSNVVLQNGTVITRSDGEMIDLSQLGAQAPILSSMTGFGNNVVIDGALQWGIPNLGLEFKDANGNPKPITLNIFVGTSLNGQTLNVVRSISPTGPWVSDGIVAPATCKVAGGICTFQATKASYYATTHTSSTSSSSSSSTSGSGGGDGLGCAVHDCSGTHPAPQNPVLALSTPGGGSAELTPGVLGTTSDQENVGVGQDQGQVQGETTATQPAAQTQDKPASSPINVRVIVLIAIALLLGFGAFKLLVK